MVGQDAQEANAGSRKAAGKRDRWLVLRWPSRMSGRRRSCWLVRTRPGCCAQSVLSLPLPPSFRDIVADQVSSTGEPLRRLPGAILGHPGTEYQPVHPTLVVEAEAEPTVETFSARLRPRVRRIRPDLTPRDIPRSPAP